MPVHYCAGVLQMETITLNQDILTYCVTADSFPDGVLQAHQTLHALLPFETQRNYFGFSWPDQKGTIIYKAAAEELHQGELAKHQLETKTIPAGKYLYIDIPDFRKDIPAIGTAFAQLIKQENITPDGFCIEWYLNQDLCRCMVKIK